MARRLLLAALAGWSVGCAHTSRQVGYTVPPEPPTIPASVYPAEIQYEVLGRVSGEACGTPIPEPRNARDAAPPPLGFEVGMGDPLLYQNARYAALSQSPDADNLTAVRVEVETTGKKQCVTLSGRAYRITAMRSVATPVAATGWATVGGLAEPEATAHSAAVRHGSADEERPNRLFFTLGAPGYGVPLYLGYGRGGAHLGFEVGALAETHGAGGIAASLRYQTSVGSLLRPYSGLRLAGLTGPHGAFARADVFGGAEVAFERLTVRAELGARVDSDLGVRPMFAVGPGLRF